MKTTINGFATSHRHVPRSAIVFYGPEEKGDQTTYATHHQVRAAAEGFELGPGVSLTTKNIKQLAHQASKGLKHEVEIIPEHVLVANDALLAWWTPAGSQLMAFDISMHDHPGKSRLQGVSAQMAVPPLVFAMRRSRAEGGAYLGLYVYGLLQNARPTADTQMFRAPLFNVNDNGDICWGNGEKPKGKSVNDIYAWQSLFFSSVFTHYNGSIPIACDDPYAFVADLIDTKANEFPKLAMKPLKKTLAQVVTSLGDGQHG
jgi:PRTRC genetic system protein B